MSVKRLRDLLKDKAFVDYFNLFLSQPTFGFKILYQFNSQKFSVDSSFGEELSHPKLLKWLELERLPLFILSPMYSEYNLSSELKKLKFNKEVFVHTCNSGHLDYTLVKIIVENIFGHYIGMQQFKKFLAGTEGEKIWQCIQDVMDYCHQDVSDKIKRYDLHHLIMKYLANGTLYELSSRMKLHLFLESDPLVNQPMENGALQNGVCFDKCLFRHEMLQKEPVKAMLRLHSFLVQDMLTYWGPCFVFHLLQERISFDLECLCKLNFTDSPGSIYNIKNLFKFSFTNCPSFLSDKANEISYMPEARRKTCPNIQEYLFGDRSICETYDSINPKMMTILLSDRLSGYPFLKFLMQASDLNGEMVFMLWEDLCQYINMQKDIKANEPVKKMLEMKIKMMYLLKERKSQNDLLDDVIKNFALTGFKMGDVDKKGKITNLFKAADMTTNILQKLWLDFIVYEKNRMKEFFYSKTAEALEKKEETDEFQSADENTDQCDISNDQTSMVALTLNSIDINRIKMPASYPSNVLSCLFSDNELEDVLSLIREHQRDYKLGKKVFKTLRSSSAENRKRVMRSRIKNFKPKPRVKIEPPMCPLKLVIELKSKIREITCDQRQKEKPKVKSLGVNPYLSIRHPETEFLPMDSSQRKKLVFQKHLRRLCQFIHEMLQPYMKELLTAYVDQLSKGGMMEEMKPQPTDKFPRYKGKQLNSYLTALNPTTGTYEKLRKKITYLSDSLQFKRNAYKMITSCQRTRINKQLRHKARHIMTNFMEGEIFTGIKKKFIFDSHNNPTADIASDTAMKLKLEGASCSLFHKLDIDVIPAVYQIWKRMGQDCLKTGGRGKFLASLDIDKESFDKKFAKSSKTKTESLQKPVKDGSLKRSQFGEQASMLKKSLHTFVDDDIFWMYRREFAYSMVECLSPDLRKLIQHRGGSQLEYVLVR